MKNWRVILVDASPRNGALQAILGEEYALVAHVDFEDLSLADIEKYLPQIIVFNVTTPDHILVEKIEAIYHRHPCAIAVFCCHSDRYVIQAGIKAGISTFIVNGFNAERVSPILEIAMARFKEVQGLRGKLQYATGLLAERKLLERAKGILMRRRDLDEKNAFETLRKMALERGKGLTETASTIIKAEALLAQH